jgi:hypothetical protein
MKPIDVLMTYGNTPTGEKALHDVVVLALTFRRHLIDKAERAVSASSSEREILRAQARKDLEEFRSSSDKILSEVSNEAVKVGREVAVDDFCSLKV